MYQNLGQFLEENSEKYKDRDAFEIKRGFRTQRFTFEEVYKLALKTAAFLKQKWLKKGDKVAIWAGNCPEYPILYFGCWLLGIIAVPIDVRTTQESLKVFLTKARCSVGFKGKFMPGSFGKLVDESFYLEDLVDLVSHLPGVNSVHLEGVRSNDLAEIAFTSGTTGTPKGVMLTHGNFLSDVEALTKAFPFRKEYRTLSLLPLSHAFEQVVDFLVLFQSGIKVTYLERTNRLTMLKAMRKNQITSAVFVPQALHLLMTGIENEVEKQGNERAWKILNLLAPTLPRWMRRLVFKSVHQKFGGNLLFFGCGSAPLSVKLARKWENLGIEIFEGYGATETTAALTINTPSAKKLGSVGKVLPGMTVRINPNTHEIEARGPNIAPGYFEDWQNSKAAFSGGWYRTGDIGEIDSHGYIYIIGREAFRIVLANGQKVYPEDIEKRLNGHPLVVQSCVIGVKREEGEVVHAAIITNLPEKLDSMIREVNEMLSSHEQILEWSHWKGENFPQTPILKIDRKKVAEIISGVNAYEDKGEVMSQDKLTNILSQITKVTLDKVKDEALLATDLKIDSLGRVELLSRIEEEFAVAIPEIKVTEQTTVEKLRTLIRESASTSEEIPVTAFLYGPFMMKFRASILQNIFFRPLHGLFAQLEIYGREHLLNLTLPAIFYFNHVGIFDAVCALRVLPASIREQLVVMVNADIWNDYRKRWVEIFAGGFPFDKKERVKASLELTGDFLDRGFSVLMAPEGTFTQDGQLLGFKSGIGLLAVEMQVPVVPIKIDPKYREIFPPMGSFWENLPKKRQKIWLKIGDPILFAKGTSYEEATSIMQLSLENL